MKNLYINICIAIAIGIIPYLVKYKKRYNLIAGNSSQKSYTKNTIQNAIHISNSTLLLSLLIIIFSILNYLLSLDEKILPDYLINFSGGIIILVALIISIIYYLIISIKKYHNSD